MILEREELGAAVEGKRFGRWKIASGVGVAVVVGGRRCCREGVVPRV